MVRPDNQTKQNIFDSAVQLFAQRSYDTVSLRKIAAIVGITEAAIYRHYESKAAILDDIFSKFSIKLKSYLLTKQQVDRLIKTDTTRQLLERCVGRFTDEDTPFMACGYRIVCMEQLTNPMAGELIIQQLHEATAESIKYVLDSLIERGQIPAIDTRFFSLLWAQSMFSGAVVWVSNYFNCESAEHIAADYNAMSRYIVDMAASGKVPAANPFYPPGK